MTTIQEIHILGCAWVYLPIIFDVVYEAKGTTHFKICQNLEVEDTSGAELINSIHKYSIHPPGEQLDLSQSTVAFGVDGPFAKHAVYSCFHKNSGLLRQNMPNIIHPSAYVSSSAILSSGVFCEPGVMISSQTEIGFGVTMKRGVSIGHHNIIGEYVEINPGVIIAGHANIGKGCILGVGSVVKNGVSIGENTFIGMGSLVNKDIPAGVVAYGSPCRVIRPNDKKPV